jgi:quinol monooxygenase YgiN
MLVRFFFSAVDPADSDEVRRIFVEDVRPAFEASGCESVDLLVNTERNAGGLLEGVVVSRWHSADDIERALRSRPVTESLVRVRQLLRLEPITRTFEVLE